MALTDAGVSTLDRLVHRSDADRAALVQRAEVTSAELDQARSVLRRLLAAMLEPAADRGMGRTGPGQRRRASTTTAPYDDQER